MQAPPSPVPSAHAAASVPELSVIVPVLNEARNVAPLLARLTPVLERVAASHEVVFVDDGSRDDTLRVLRAAAAADPRVRAVSLSRNFGKEVAIAAGLDRARGRGVVLMDADLQHPPEAIPDLVARWREGYDNVYAQRTDRLGEAPARRAFARAFYRLFDRVAEMALPEGAGDFRLLDRRAVEALRQLPERARFSKGLYAWIGFRAIGVPFRVEARAHGTTTFNFRRLLRFALDGLTSFTTAPLRIWTYAGLLISMVAFAAAVYVIARTLLFGADVPGFPSLIVSVMFFAGVQLISLGVIGEYVGRIFAEVKRRPLYLVSEEVGPRSGASAGGEPPRPIPPAAG